MDQFIRHLNAPEPMTVGIAAICDIGYEKLYPKIVLCADRQVSSVVQYEGSGQKIKQMTPYCCAMASSTDSETSDMILEDARKKIQKRIQDGQSDLPIKDIVDIVKEECESFKQAMIEKDVLSKFNLTIKNTGTEPQTLAGRAIEEVNRYQYQLKFDFIILGFDSPTEPHIYVIDQDGNYRLCDSSGSAMIGSGSLLAFLQLTKSGHSKNEASVKTIPKVYFSKKVSERTGTVGRTTDLYAFFSTYVEPIPTKPTYRLVDFGTPGVLMEMMDGALDEIAKFENTKLTDLANTIYEILTGGKPT
jgi:20S proteasome alpha/beta subunit